MALRKILQQLGFWTTVVKWKEPMLYRVRLRGDLVMRSIVAFSIGALATAVLLVLFAINVNPPSPIFALAAMLLIGGLAFGILVGGKNTAGGTVRICQEGVWRKRFYVGFLEQWAEDAKWPYAALRQAVLVPAQAIRKPFSVLVLSDGEDYEIVGVPCHIPLEQLAGLFSSQGVAIQYGASVPPSYAKPFSLPVALACGVIGLVMLVTGLGFYTVKVAFAEGGLLAQRGAAAERPDHRQHFADHPVRPRERAGAAAPAQPDQVASPSTTPSPSVAPPPISMPPIPSPFGGRRFGPGVGGPPGAGAPPGFGAPPVAGQGASVQNGPGQSPPSAASSGERTSLVGGSEGGFPYETVDPEQQTVVGFRWWIGKWLDKEAIMILDPLYHRDANAQGVAAFIAREGYVVGGLQVHADDLVRAVRVVFVRQTEDGALAKSDFYMSDWAGTTLDGKPTTLGDGKTRIIGVHGRKGAVINAIGLVLEKPQEE